MIMGQGICADCYVGNRKTQELFRREMGGSDELPMDIQRRLDSLKRRKKKIAPRRAERKIIMNKSETDSSKSGNPFQQRLENLPDEILKQKRFFEVGADKVPRLKGWSNPDNQKLYSEIEGYGGFDTTGHGVADDVLFLDFDHIFTDKGEFVNAKAEKCFNYVVDALKTYCELSVSGTGAHAIAVPTAGKFKKIASGKNGRIDLGDGACLEIFYKTGGRYCLFTGNVYRCEPNAPVAHGQAVDDVFKTLLDKITKQNQKPHKSTPARSEGQSTELIYSSADARKENSSKLGIEYDLFRAQLMLDAINPAVLDDSDWLAVISSAKNIGVPYPVVDAFNRRDPDRYDESENLKRWDSLSDPSFNIETLHGFAKRFGYEEKSSMREWFKLHPELTTEIIHRPAQMDDQQQEKFSWTQDKIKSCPVNLRLSKSYEFSQRGIFLIVPPKKAGDAPKKICAAKTPIVPTKIFRAPRSNNYTYEVAILIRGKWGTTEIDGKALADPRAIIALAGCGALIDEPKLICRYLNAMIALNPDLQEIKAYDQPGWHDGKFIYPTGGDNYIVRRAGFDYDAIFATRGNPDILKGFLLDALDNGGAVANAYLGTALSAPLVQPLNILNAQIQLHSKSGSGKTALAKLAAAIYGNPRELIRTFGATEKNLQAVAAAFNDLPNFIDEMETMGGKRAENQLSQMIYSYAEGKGNQAQKRNGEARQAFRFSGARLMTAERPILKEHDLRGAYKRLVQIRCPKLFDDDFATDLHFIAENHFGHFGRPWVEFVTVHRKDISSIFYKFEKILRGKAQDIEPTQLKSMTVAAIAPQFFKMFLGVKDKFDDTAAATILKEILPLLPTTAELDDTKRALESLASFVAGHIKSFVRPVKDQQTGKIDYVAAWGTECFGKIFDTSEVAFLPHALKKILEEDLHFASADKLINEWKEQGDILITDAGHTTHKVTIGEAGRTRAYHFKAQVLIVLPDDAEALYYEEIGAV